MIFHDINQNCFSNLQHQIFSFFSPEGISCSVKGIHLLQQFQSPTSNSEGLKKKRTPPFHWEITSFSCTTTLTIWNSLLTLSISFSVKKCINLDGLQVPKPCCCFQREKIKLEISCTFPTIFVKQKKGHVLSQLLFSKLLNSNKLFDYLLDSNKLFDYLLDSNKPCDFSLKNF